MKKTVKPTISVKQLESILKYFGYFKTNRNNGHGQIWEPIAYENKGIYFTAPTTDKAANDAAVEHLKEAFSIINDTNGELIDSPKSKHKLTPEEINEFIKSTKDYNPNGGNQYRCHFEKDKKNKQNELKAAQAAKKAQESENIKADEIKYAEDKANEVMLFGERLQLATHIKLIIDSIDTLATAKSEELESLINEFEKFKKNAKPCVAIHKKYEPDFNEIEKLIKNLRKKEAKKEPQYSDAVSKIKAVAKDFKEYETDEELAKSESLEVLQEAKQVVDDNHAIIKSQYDALVDSCFEIIEKMSNLEDVLGLSDELLPNDRVKAFNERLARKREIVSKSLERPTEEQIIIRQLDGLRVLMPQLEERIEETINDYEYIESVAIDRGIIPKEYSEELQENQDGQLSFKLDSNNKIQDSFINANNDILRLKNMYSSTKELDEYKQLKAKIPEKIIAYFSSKDNMSKSIETLYSLYSQMQEALVKSGINIANLAGELEDELTLQADKTDITAEELIKDVTETDTPVMVEDIDNPDDDKEKIIEKIKTVLLKCENIDRNINILTGKYIKLLGISGLVKNSKVKGKKEIYKDTQDIANYIIKPLQQIQKETIKDKLEQLNTIIGVIENEKENIAISDLKEYKQIADNALNEIKGQIYGFDGSGKFSFEDTIKRIDELCNSINSQLHPEGEIKDDKPDEPQNEEIKQEQIGQQKEEPEIIKKDEPKPDVSEEKTIEDDFDKTEKNINLESEKPEISQPRKVIYSEEAANQTLNKIAQNLSIMKSNEVFANVKLILKGIFNEDDFERLEYCTKEEYSKIIKSKLSKIAKDERFIRIKRAQIFAQKTESPMDSYRNFRQQISKRNAEKINEDISKCIGDFTNKDKESLLEIISKQGTYCNLLNDKNTAQETRKEVLRILLEDFDKLNNTNYLSNLECVFERLINSQSMTEKIDSLDELDWSEFLK